jgi:hypothetical protein
MGYSESRGKRLFGAFIARNSGRLADRALTLIPNGNREIFLRQQHAELVVIASIFQGRTPPPSIRQELNRILTIYHHAGDARGEANATAALSLDAMGHHDWLEAERLLDSALHLYHRPGAEGIDPSGQKLVEQRRQLLHQLQ